MADDKINVDSMPIPYQNNKNNTIGVDSMMVQQTEYQPTHVNQKSGIDSVPNNSVNELRKNVTPSSHHQGKQNIGVKVEQPLPQIVLNEPIKQQQHSGYVPASEIPVPPLIKQNEEAFYTPKSFDKKFEEFMFLRDSYNTTNLHLATSNYEYFENTIRHFNIHPNNYISIQNAYGHTLLMFSIFNRTLDVTDLLLNKLHARPDQVDNENRNLYHYVAEINQSTYLKNFIEIDHIPSKISSEMLKVWDIMGQRAVEIAIKNKNITMLYHFINKGANLDTIEAKMLYTDLHQAALTDDINVTRLVLNNIDIKNIDLAGADDLTALHRAVINTNNEITELLLSYGADPKLTVNGSSILGLAPLSEAGDEIVNIIRKYCSDDVYANLEEYRFSNDDDGYDDDDDEAMN